MIISGIYLFFFLEYVMKMIVRFKEKSSCDDNEEGMVRLFFFFVHLHAILLKVSE